MAVVGPVLCTVTSAWVVTEVVAVEVPWVGRLGSDVVVVAVAVLLSVPAGVFALIAAVMVMVWVLGSCAAESVSVMARVLPVWPRVNWGPVFP